MQLLRALRIKKGTRLAFIGAGGKTTALFQLSNEILGRSRSLESGIRELSNTVFITATTHLALEQCSLADRHIVIEKNEDFDNFAKKSFDGIILFSGQLEGERVIGLSHDQIEGLRRLADTQQIPLLIEADGSRLRPVKAPASHEPVVPIWVDVVVVVVGLSALDQQLTSDWVHRPERFAELAGLNIGDTIDYQALVRVLKHPNGGLQGIPASARSILLLNQANSRELRSQALKLVERLRATFDSIIVASLLPISYPSNILDGIKIDNTYFDVFTVHEPVAGIVLAAGASRRFGQLKQVLPWRGIPIVRHVTQTALLAGLSQVLVITGNSASKVEDVVIDLPIKLVRNNQWQKGQSTSVIASLRALDNAIGAAIFLLADQPLVPSELLRGLVDYHAATLAHIVAPQVSGQRANPVLFDQVTFHSLMELKGEEGGRQLFSHYPVSWFPWHDSNIMFDIDTQQDYENLLAM